MKVVIAAILILVLFCAGAVLVNRSIVRDSEKIIKDIGKLEDNIKQGNWNQAEEKLNDIKGKWKKTKGFWELFLEHYEMDNIDVTIAKIDSYVNSEEATLALGEMAKLKHLVDHIAQKDKLRLGNIL